MSYLIVGLGNPGSKYRDTRHNIGFMSADSFADQENIPWKEKFKAEYGTFSYKGEKGYIVKPMTFMNLSGESVQKAAQFFKVEKENILVLHDELDLPFGTVELKKGGGLAGHNGLKSIAELLGTRDFFLTHLQFLFLSQIFLFLILSKTKLNAVCLTPNHSRNSSIFLGFFDW